MKLRLWNTSFALKPVGTTEEVLSRMYNRAATQWDTSIARMGYIRAYHRLIARLAATGALAPVPDNGLVLDAGIGTGALSNAFATAAPASHIVGVDVADAMLDMARQRVPQLVATHQTSITCLPFPDAHFDFVMTAHVLEHLPAAMDGISELLRVLKPGQPFLLIVTWPCPITRLLSLRWKFAAIPTATMCQHLTNAGIPTVAISTLTRPFRMAYMSRVYVGSKPESTR